MHIKISLVCQALLKMWDAGRKEWETLEVTGYAAGNHV